MQPAVKQNIKTENAYFFNANSCWLGIKYNKSTNQNVMILTAGLTTHIPSHKIQRSVEKDWLQFQTFI